MLSALVGAAAALGGVSATPYYATVGTTVQIAGDGMSVGEAVTVDVTYPDSTLAQEDTVAADGSGNFGDSYTIKDDDPVGIYTVTAIGQESGNVYTTTFDPAPLDTNTSITFTQNHTSKGSTPLTASQVIYGDKIKIGGAVTDEHSNAVPVGSVDIRQSDEKKSSPCATPNFAPSHAQIVEDLALDSGGAYLSPWLYPFLVTFPANGGFSDANGTRYFLATGLSVGSYAFEADYSGWHGAGPSYKVSDACGQLEVVTAPTDTSIANTPATTLALGNSLSVDYKVESAYGVSGNTATGTASIQETDANGTLGCGPGNSVSAVQSDATGDGAADAGFGSTGTLSCTPTAVGTYTYNVNFHDTDGNYDDSYSSPDRSLSVTSGSVQVCKAAPAIAVAYMQSKGVKPGSKTWSTVITDVAHQTGSNGQFFAKHACDPGYADAVTSYINTKYHI